MKRKKIAAVLAAVLVLSLAGCGRKEAPQTQPTAQETAAPTMETAAQEPWMAAFGEELFRQYGVLPEYYENLGDGRYAVYVEVGGEVVPFVTVDSATGDYHG